jgi:hypothetical protein
MTNEPFALKEMSLCEAGELMRLENGDWAIMANGQGAHVKQAVVISSVAAPSIQNKMTWCLSYGKDFTLVPDHTGPFEIVANVGPHEGGELMFAREFGQGHTPITKRYLAIADHQPLYLRLDDFAIASSANSVSLARFKKWTLLKQFPSFRDPLELVSYAPK